MEEKIDRDLQSRDTIVNDIKHNYFVEASAGSGKTTSLVYRMVALVESGVPVDKICTITFTKAAANEFFERFQRLLSIRSGDEKDRSDKSLPKRTEQSKKRCQQALRNIDLCFLGTIDSFCNMIAHEMPAELGIPASSTVISKDEYKAIIKEKYNNILKNTKHDLHQLAIKFNNFIDNPFKAFTKGVAELSDIRNLKIDYDPTISEIDFDAYFTKEDKKAVLEILDNFTSVDPLDLYSFSSKADNDRAKAKLDVERSYKLLSFDVKNWSDQIGFLKQGLKGIKKMEGFIEEAKGTSIGNYLTEIEENKKASLKYNQEFNDLLTSIQTKINEYLYSLYFRFILSVLEEINASLRKEGKFQFFDFLLYLRDAFKKSAFGDRVLINHVFERHSYFMLDESQDTNPLQTEMFFYLTSTKVDEDWKKMSPKEESLFIVGDPKQSIYSFRGADVKAYLDNKEIFKTENELLVLTRNYRSHASLRRWFNDTFNKILNYETEDMKEFALEHINIPIDDDDITSDLSLNDPKVMEGVYRYTVTTGRGANDIDSEQVAKLIIDFKNNKQINRVYFNKEKGQMDVKADDIDFSDFLVVPFSSNMEKLVEAFAKYNIPVVVEGKIDFESAETFNIVLDLLNLMKEPKNKAVFNRVIFSKLYNLNDLDNIQMLNDGFDLDISNPDIEQIVFTNQKHQEIINQLHALYNKVLGMSFSSSMLLILNDKDINIFKVISADNLEYIYYLIEKIKEGEESGNVTTLEQLRDFVSNFIDGGDEQRTLRFKEKVNRVKIANLHKVKGLQAPIVILARPTNSPIKASKYIDYKVNPPTVKIAYISDDDFMNVHIVETKRFEDEKVKWDAYSKAEQDRLAYVGATRAEAVLIVCEKKDGSGYWSELSSHIDRDLSVPSTEETLPETEEVALGEYRINEESYKPSFDYVSPSQSRMNRKSNKDEIDDAIYEDSSEGREKATMLGTMVHRLMECIVSSKNTYDIDLLIKNILSDYGYSKEYEEILHNIASKIRNGGFEQVNSSLDKNILKTLLEAKKVWCEVPFSYQSNKGNIVHGIIDCMYLDKNDKYHVIDYKTNKEKDVFELEKHYEGQLTHYKLALKKMCVETDAHIYHIDLDK